MAWHPTELDTGAFVAQCPEEIYDMANERVVSIFALNWLQARHWVKSRLQHRAVQNPYADNCSVPMWLPLPQQQRWYCYLGVFWTAGGKSSHHPGNGGWWPLLPPLSSILYCHFYPYNELLFSTYVYYVSVLSRPTYWMTVRFVGEGSCCHTMCWFWQSNYRQVSNISGTKSQHSSDSRNVLRLSLPNPLKPVVKSRMKM